MKDKVPTPKSTKQPIKLHQKQRVHQIAHQMIAPLMNPDDDDDDAKMSNNTNKPQTPKPKSIATPKSSNTKKEGRRGR